MQGDNFGSGSFLSSSTQVKGLKSSSPPLSAWYSPFQLNRGARELPPREAHSFLRALQFCLAGELSSQTINQHCQTNHSGQNNRCSDSPQTQNPQTHQMCHPKYLPSHAGLSLAARHRGSRERLPSSSQSLKLLFLFSFPNCSNALFANNMSSFCVTQLLYPIMLSTKPTSQDHQLVDQDHFLSSVL